MQCHNFIYFYLNKYIRNFYLYKDLNSDKTILSFFKVNYEFFIDNFSFPFLIFLKKQKKNNNYC